MRPVRRFEVTPAIPPALAVLPELAANLHWSWDPEATRLFARLWPGWHPGDAHPAEMVRATTADRLGELAADNGVINDLGAVYRRLQTALKGPTWFGGRDASPLRQVAYFSPEFGISEAVPQYSGGLGVLAGDHLKASSDLGVPLVAVGLLYTEGYFRQRLDAEGWQQESVADFTPLSLGFVDTGVEVTVDLAGDPVTAHVWRADVGRIPLYMLDTDVEGNSPDGIAVTDRLYGGDEHHRLRQEIVLGIGGVRALRALGLTPDVFHMNEGHAGFLGLERIRELVADGKSFHTAAEMVRGGSVFTTHTPVPAGIDRFPRELMEDYFTSFAKELDVTFDELFAIGEREDEPDGTFNMAVMGLRLAARSNGVAELHGAVSREMFHGLWPDLDVDDVPIGSITNGVHGRTWVSARVDALLSRVVGEDWPAADAGRWSRIVEVDPLDAWSTLNDGRDELVRLARRRLGEDVLDPSVLTIGFARRFATYKRATLLAVRHRAPLRAALRRRAPGAVRLRRQGPPGRQPGQAADPAHRAVRPLGRRPPPLRVPGRLRHLDRPVDVPRVRRVAEHAAPAAGGVRHVGHEGRAQRGAQLQHPRRLVGRVLRRHQRVGHRLGRGRSRPGPPRPARGGEPVRDPREPARAPVLRPRTRRHPPPVGEHGPRRMGLARPAGDGRAHGARLHDGPVRTGCRLVDPAGVGRRGARGGAGRMARAGGRERGPACR